MDVKKKRYVFIAIAFLLLVLMILMSRNAGINCDEAVHYDQSVAVWNYFSTHGKDRSALDTPLTHLKYYGQSYDNITTFLINLLGIEDIYGFRHLMSTMAGWLAIVISALLAVWLSGYEAGIIVLILFALSPTFLGHAQNNLKDVPFALAYVSGTYFTFRFLSSGRKNSGWDVLCLTLSIAFCISIRPGGIILICSGILFLLAFYLVGALQEGSIALRDGLKKLLIITAISASGYLLSTILWPFALQDPLRNPVISYKVMLDYPETFRQIFEGRNEWSDFMPWYYLPKSMAITIPLLVTAGFILSPLLLNIITVPRKRIFTIFLLTSVIIPVLFVVIRKSNLYSSWRHFLFVYPGMVVLASMALAAIYKYKEGNYRKLIFILAFAAASIHPFLFILRNPNYSYLYYNQLAGGVKGAYGNYETDYYFISQREASEWLIKYLDNNNIKDTLIVGSNYSASWFFRQKPNIRNVYFRNEERSMHDWDYAITTNRYIPPSQLKSKIWPPADALKIIYVDGAAVSAVIKRKTKADLYGFMALGKGSNAEAIRFFEEALRINDRDEMIFYNFAVALNRTGQRQRADSALVRCLELNPGFEPALMYLGNIAVKDENYEKAKEYYKKLISINRKYTEAYEALKKIKNNLK
jgi:tetratricopeptide (TPR) repeat protein